MCLDITMLLGCKKKKSHGILSTMDIIRKQQDKTSINNYNLTSRSNNREVIDTWSGAYSDTTTIRTKNKTFNKHLKNSQLPTQTRPIASLPSNRGEKIFWFSLILFIFAIFFAGGFFIYRTNNIINTVTDGNKKHSFIKIITNLANPESYKILNGFSSGRINILLLGRANSHKSGKNLTDTIMMLSINTADYTVGLFSIPRDFLVQTHGNTSVHNGYYVKINSLYQTGLRNDVGTKYITEAVENITGQDIHYYFILDFEGFKKIINLLGGINVDVPKHIKDERYPGPGYTYETFEVYPGLQKFDGATALKYARTRHDADGDFGRAARQQQVMQSVRNKAFSLGTIINPIKINELLNTLGEHVHTNISPNEIEPFISLIKKLDTHNITNIVIDAWKPESLLISVRHHNNRGGISGLMPRSGNYSEIQEQAENLFDLDKIKQRHGEIKKESPTIILVTDTTKNNTALHQIKQTLSSLGFDDITTKLTTNLPNKTTVIDNTKGTKPFSLDELIKKLPATIDTQSIMSLQKKYEDADFVILLGNDIVDAYNYTEISQDELENESVKNN